jgi:hypothetical protein
VPSHSRAGSVTASSSRSQTRTSWSGVCSSSARAQPRPRDPSEIVIHCSAATYVSSNLGEAREQTRWFPALVGNHIADILRHHDAQDLPDALFTYVHDRPEYDYRQHGHAGAEHSKYVSDEICDRFCVLGSDEECEAKLRQLAEIGVSEFNIYP